LDDAETAVLGGDVATLLGSGRFNPTKAYTLGEVTSQLNVCVLRDVWMFIP